MTIQDDIFGMVTELKGGHYLVRESFMKLQPWLVGNEKVSDGEAVVYR